MNDDPASGSLQSSTLCLWARGPRYSRAARGGGTTTVQVTRPLRRLASHVPALWITRPMYSHGSRTDASRSQRDDHRAESNRARERPLSVMVEWCGGQMPTLMGFAAWAREAALRSLGASNPTPVFQAVTRALHRTQGKGSFQRFTVGVQTRAQSSSGCDSCSASDPR
jgi:hypothetical protein